MQTRRVTTSLLIWLKSLSASYCFRPKTQTYKPSLSYYSWTNLLYREFTVQSPSTQPPPLPPHPQRGTGSSRKQCEHQHETTCLATGLSHSLKPHVSSHRDPSPTELSEHVCAAREMPKLPEDCMRWTS